jgi:hypothetical protein
VTESDQILGIQKTRLRKAFENHNLQNLFVPRAKILIKNPQPWATLEQNRRISSGKHDRERSDCTPGYSFIYIT